MNGCAGFAGGGSGIQLHGKKRTAASTCQFPPQNVEYMMSRSQVCRYFWAYTCEKPSAAVPAMKMKYHT